MLDQVQIYRRRRQPAPAFTHLIDGRHVAASDGRVMSMISPINGQILMTIVRGIAADMPASIASARAAFVDRRRSGQSRAARKKVLLKWADLIDAHALELAVLGVRAHGTEITMALEAGLPPGVLSAVTGEGGLVGKTPGLSMDRDVFVFKGSGQTGRRLVAYAARPDMKRVCLELGGKSPSIVFADAPDLDKAAKVAAKDIFRNAAQADGGQMVTGGKWLLEYTGGYYMAPTIVTGVTREATLARKEVFGPVLAVTPFETEAEAVDLEKATVFGLAGAAWTANLSRAHRMIRAVRTGVMHINICGGTDATVPLAGVRQSGNRADKPLYAIDKYVNLKTAWIKL